MICVLYALEEEVASITQQLSGAEELAHPWATIKKGMLGHHKICLIKSGAGKVLAAMTTQSIIAELKPRMVILCGVSGALNPEYARGDLVIGYDFIQHDISTEYFGFEPGQIPFTEYKIIPATESFLERAKTFSLEDANVHTGRIISGDQFISGTRGGELREQFAGDAVDMESAAVAFVCHLNHTPFIVARTISDKADETAADDFGGFLEQASKHTVDFITHVLSDLA